MDDKNRMISTENYCTTMEYLYKVEGYLTLTIGVKSGVFMGKSNFCISEEQLEIFIDSLNEINLRLSGDFRMDDYDSDAHIIFEATKLGNVVVTGQLEEVMKNTVCGSSLLLTKQYLRGLCNCLNL
ncbi:hypothetical protein [Paenibacillus spiritus]|uniref:hypothetical protein n=1 Tax=Paenibacillus spiritus TaxID=2496557 RepID=UPI001CC43056|nr:hypothetical protein [Paenibacillus spiritus]